MKKHLLTMCFSGGISSAINLYKELKIEFLSKYFITNNVMHRTSMDGAEYNRHNTQRDNIKELI